MKIKNTFFYIYISDNTSVSTVTSFEVILQLPPQATDQYV